ncbi:MAG: efflux RND transporter permease subunit, partial [Acidobacteriota bacterium]
SFGRINHGYNAILAFFLRRRLDLVMAVTAVVAITVAWPAQKIESGVVQEDERGGFEVDVNLPPSTTLEEAEAHFGRVEKILEAKQQEWDLQTYLIVHSRAGGEVQGWFNTPRNNDVSTRELVEELVELMPERAGSEIYTGLGNDDADERKNLQIYRLVGEDPRQLEELGSDLEGVLGKVEGVIGVKQTAAEGSEEMAIRLDRERVQRLGINPQAVAGVIRNSIGGRSLPKFYRDGREIPVRVRYQEEDRESLGQLWDFRVPTASGDVVSLGAVTRAERLEGADRIFRTNKQVTRSITLELRDGDEKETRKRLDALVAQIDLPEGVKFGSPRRGGGSVDDVQQMIFAAGLSVVFIYLLMGFLFESFILPLSIVTTIPLAALGVVWGHFFSGVDMDSLGWVGAVLLIGVVVNNGIVLVDAVNRLRAEGMGRTEALLASADRRFRPIMMTALTTICGMVPLLIGQTSSIGLSYQSFGVTLIGGMTVATLLTLLVVPVAYTFFDDIRRRLELLVSRVFKGDPADADADFEDGAADAPDPAVAGG